MTDIYDVALPTPGMADLFRQADRIQARQDAASWTLDFEATMAREYAILTDPTSPAEVEACAAMMVSSARWE